MATFVLLLFFYVFFRDIGDICELSFALARGISLQMKNLLLRLWPKSQQFNEPNYKEMPGFVLCVWSVTYCAPLS